MYGRAGILVAAYRAFFVDARLPWVVWVGAQRSLPAHCEEPAGEDLQALSAEGRCGQGVSPTHYGPDEEGYLQGEPKPPPSWSDAVSNN
jgi:hypothetical protein